MPLCLGFVGYILAEKNIVSCVSVLSINHFDVGGGHFTKWRPFPWILLFISATTMDTTTIVIYSCKLYRVAELRKKTTAIRTKSVCTPCWGCLFENGRPSPEYYPIVQKLWDVCASRCLWICVHGQHFVQIKDLNLTCPIIIIKVMRSIV